MTVPMTVSSNDPTQPVRFEKNRNKGRAPLSEWGQEPPGRSKAPNQPRGDRQPRRIGDDALPSAGSGRKQMELAQLPVAGFAADQPPEQEAPGGARDQHVAVRSEEHTS